VLAAMGVAPEIAQGAIRVSLGFGSENTDIQRYLSTFGALVKRLKQNAKEAA
jgi:cysteine desulfurase